MPAVLPRTAAQIEHGAARRKDGRELPKQRRDPVAPFVPLLQIKIRLLRIAVERGPTKAGAI